MKSNGVKAMQDEKSILRPQGGLAVVFAIGLASACAGSQKPVGETPADVVASGDSHAASRPERQLTTEQKADFEKAVKSYNNLRRSGPLTGAACKEAAEAFGRAAEQNPTLLEARFNEGAVYMECGMEKDAKAAWEKQMQGSRRYGPALTNLGFLAWRQGDLMGAESYFNRALEADKQNVEAHNNLAQILRDKAHRAMVPEDRLQYAKKAVDHLRTVLAIDGNNLQAYSTLSFVYYELGKLELAKLVAAQAVARADEIATGVYAEESFEQGGIDKKKGGKKAAAPKKEKAKKDEAPADDQKTSTEVAGGASSAPASAGGPSSGTGYTKEMNEQLAVVHNTLGLVELKKKNVTMAIAQFKNAIERNPQFNEARLNLAALSLQFRDYKTAEENFRAVLQSQPRNYEAMIGLGVSLRGSKKFAEAEAQYEAAKKLDPSNPQSYYNLGLLYQDYKGGEKPALQKAQDFYRDFLAKANERTPADMKEEAQTRIKNIDEIYKALEEAKKLQAEAEEMQRKMEEQQKKMEEEAKKQEAAGGGAPAAGGPAAAPGATQAAAPPGGAANTAPASAPTTPPPAAEPAKPEKKK